MLRVGIIGFGGMGMKHFGCYDVLHDAEVTAVADVRADRLKPGAASMRINIGEGSVTIDADRHKLYSNPDDLVADPDVDVVDICLPTFLHAEYAKKALRAGKHVLCEKPMALTYAECLEVLEVAKDAPGKFMVAQCVRFFPAYDYLNETVQSDRLGRILQLSMWRGSALPTWSWEHWLRDHKRSGGMIVDLHVHDADFVHYLLGRPKAVCSTGAIGGTGGYDVVDTQYIYEQKVAVRASGNVTLPSDFGFEACFFAAFERGCMRFSTADPRGLTETTEEGAHLPDLPQTDGYQEEIAYFVRCVLNDEEPAMVEPESSAFSLRLVEAERQSIETGRAVEL